MCASVHTLDCNLPRPTGPDPPPLTYWVRPPTHPLGQTGNGATIRVPTWNFLLSNCFVSLSPDAFDEMDPMEENLAMST